VARYYPACAGRTDRPVWCAYHSTDQSGTFRVFQKRIKERWALLLAVVLAGGLAALEMFLTGQLKAVFNFS
jgi:hypothetical protein